MAIVRAIRILEPDSNKSGDLFATLVGDLFFALGYDDLRFSVHKPGRELDIVGMHRTEHRKVVAECKATAEKIGGAEINKFMGAVDAEQQQNKGYQVSAYFVSLSGFTVTAIEQEEAIIPSRVILFDASRVLIELEKGILFAKSTMRLSN